MPQVTQLCYNPQRRPLQAANVPRCQQQASSQRSLASLLASYFSFLPLSLPLTSFQTQFVRGCHSQAMLGCSPEKLPAKSQVRAGRERLRPKSGVPICLIAHVG